MKLSRLNLVMAIVSLGGSVGLLAMGEIPSGLIWFVSSLIWLIIAVLGLQGSAEEPRPVARLARRLSRLLLWS